MAQRRRANQPRKPVADLLAELVTESVHPEHQDLDLLSAREIVERIHVEMSTVPAVVEGVLPEIATLAEWAASAFRSGGRLIFVGAGTSGRLGVLEAAECPPTFGVPVGQVVGVIAGGRGTLVRSREGVEDERAPARREIRRLETGMTDIVVGLAASRRTPFVLAALSEARRRGARTVLLHCNPPGPEEAEVDLVIRPRVGPEIIAGSTRMKSGTAQKIILNLITTTAMVLAGRVFGNLMVDLQARSLKLRERSLRLVQQTTGVSRPQAGQLLKSAGGSVKVAILMGRAGVTRRRAHQLLARHDGFLRRALEESGVDSRPIPESNS
ncbi:MAG: N-acetylmuramic acid 6-phosphate etherase [Candidatus Eisenbacteria bacterium]|uniref:N-acetylmuramic acid 6-phosphate etherase n=1 Tax=Eiseniibacteriota bacterium TaxID=2212470 RepID=A0A948RWX8_UNCEI|nr:N-acetylmuramic acid 6-phosphate etherase [Candidatus Eisenbacteria bacterium]MBU1949524.1 N-acetylmuramic acid 6-phosphate etherase [Candidatus Eisenbacteria bacterium]MBU2692555.1 N-acetylmuramic acid 6-phosphate etherase [Candidatus Eisenbacteria bacterium]